MSHWVNSSISSRYAAFRPQYTKALFEAVASRCSARQVLIDIGCGTGQAVQGLSPYFETVIGVDPSPTQIESAVQLPNAQYFVGGAEQFSTVVKAAIPNVAADCVTCTQAVHWFDIPKFLAEVDRVLKPGGQLVIVNYPTCVVEPSLVGDRLHAMDRHLLENGFWPPERWHIDENYARLLPQFDEKTWGIPTHEVFPLASKMSLTRLGEYLSTWSGINRHRQANPNEDILENFLKDCREAGGPAVAEGEELTVNFSFNVFYFTKQASVAN